MVRTRNMSTGSKQDNDSPKKGSPVKSKSSKSPRTPRRSNIAQALDILDETSVKQLRSRTISSSSAASTSTGRSPSGAKKSPKTEIDSSLGHVVRAEHKENKSSSEAKKSPKSQTLSSSRSVPAVKLTALPEVFEGSPVRLNTLSLKRGDEAEQGSGQKQTESREGKHKQSRQTLQRSNSSGSINSVSTGMNKSDRPRTTSGSSASHQTDQKPSRTSSKSPRRTGRSEAGSTEKSPRRSSITEDSQSDGGRKRTSSISSASGRRRKASESEFSRCHSYYVHRVRFFEYKPQAINNLACDKENNRLALSRADGSIEIWTFGGEKADMYQQLIIQTEPGTSIEAMIWRSGVFYTAGLDGYLIQYDMHTLKPEIFVPSYTEAIWCLSLDHSENYLAAGTEDGCVVLFEFTGQSFSYYKALQKQDERMFSIDWHYSGEVIVTGGIDNIRLWSVKSGHVIQRIMLARQNQNTQTIVWAVSLLKDMTIVSGDSRGKLTFWNGEQGTQIKMFGSHRADILSICVSENERVVYAAGTDPTVVQFELAPVSSSSDWLVWQRASVRAHHTHDVRCIAEMNNHIITAGVDCSIVAVNYEERNKYKSVPLPQMRLVHVAKESKLILLQYTQHLHVWKLGAPSSLTPNDDTHCLPLASEAQNLLELRTCNEEHIVCSSISDSGEYLAYADRNQLRIFHISLPLAADSMPKVSATRIKRLPAHLLQSSVRCMEFVNNCNLILAYTDGTIKLVELSYINHKAQIDNIVSSVPLPEHGVPRLLSLSMDGKLSVTDSKCNIFIYEYSKHNIQFICRLPRRDYHVTAMTFSPDGDKLALAYSLSTHKILEYSISQRRYIGSHSSHSSAKDDRLSTVTKVINMSYAKHTDTIILLQDALGVRAFDTTNGMLSQHRNFYKNRYLMHFEELDTETCIIVERSPAAINSCLPQLLGKKQFGA